MVESHISMSLFSKERRSMMGSMFDGMEIVVDVILEVRSQTELGTTRGMDQVSVGSRAAVVGLPRS